MKPEKCSTGKKKSTRRQAEREARFLRYEKKYKYMTPMAYPCKKCRWWHVGNSDDNHSR